MPRTTLDYHDDRRDAVSALLSLREVGLNADDVASIWKAAPADPRSEAADSPIEFYEVDLAGVGALQLSGWFAQAAMDALAAHRAIDLPSLLSAAGVEVDAAEQVRSTLSRGGGVTGVRARDSLLQQGD